MSAWTNPFPSRKSPRAGRARPDRTDRRSQNAEGLRGIRRGGQPCPPFPRLIEPAPEAWHGVPALSYDASAAERPVTSTFLALAPILGLIVLGHALKRLRFLPAEG